MTKSPVCYCELKYKFLSCICTQNPQNQQVSQQIFVQCFPYTCIPVVCIHCRTTLSKFNSKHLYAYNQPIMCTPYIMRYMCVVSLFSLCIGQSWKFSRFFLSRSFVLFMNDNFMMEWHSMRMCICGFIAVTKGNCILTNELLFNMFIMHHL